MNAKPLFVSSLVALAVSNVQAQDASLDQAIRAWPQAQQETVRMLVEQYGQPSGVMESRVVWTEPESPWQEIVVYQEAVDHDFPMPHKDYLEQSVYHEVPADKMDELAAYDGSIIVYRTEGRLAARCDKEAANFLALNLAHDIINEDKSVEEARQEYADAVQQMQAGNTPDVMRQLSFEPMSAEDAADRDVSLIEGAGQQTASTD